MTDRTSEKHRFHNRLRILMGIDRHELEQAGVIPIGDHNAWAKFTRDPYRFAIRADDETYAGPPATRRDRSGSRGRSHQH